MNNRPLVPRGHVQGVWSGRLHIVCYYGLYCVKQLMYTTVGAHPHENLQILSDSYQMVYVLLACFFFLSRGLRHLSWRPDVFHSSAAIGKNFFPGYTSALTAFFCTFSNVSYPFMKSLSLASVQCCGIEVLQKHLNHHINLKSTWERATF